MQSIQMQLSKKQKTFSEFYSVFFEFTLNILRKKDDSHSLYISEIRECKRRG